MSHWSSPLASGSRRKVKTLCRGVDGRTRGSRVDLSGAPLFGVSRSSLALLQVFRYPSCRSKREPMSSRIDLPQGTLDLLILRTLSLEPQHGWGISERVQQISSNVLQVQQGSLYPALHRLERRGWIKARWGMSENSRRAKYYNLTREIGR